VRERFFTPRLRVRNFEELNAWLLDQCVAYARARAAPRSHTAAGDAIWVSHQLAPPRHLDRQKVMLFAKTEPGETAFIVMAIKLSPFDR